MHLAVKVGLFVLTVFLINQVDSTQCSNCNKRDDCDCSDDNTKVICTDIGRSIPSCIPQGVTELRIQESPNFSKIGRTDLRKFEKLQKLSIVTTGLKNLHKNALKTLKNFQAIEIISGSNFTSFSSRTFDGMSKLKNITVQSCKSFHKLQNNIFGSLNGLEVLNLKDNDLQEIEEDILDKTTNVTSIDLSDNDQLEVLPRYVFTHLNKLNELILMNCSLGVLYPEHVKSGSLTRFDGTYNNWQCDEMCDFFTWLESDDSFRKMAKMGWCADSNNSSNSRVLSLHPEDVCETGNIVLQVLVGVLFASILALTCCFLWVTCVAKHCRCFKCSSSSDTSARSSRGGNNVAPARDHGNPAYVEADETPQLSNEAILQADCNVGDWNINSVDPPLYEVVVGHGANDEDKENFDNSDSESDIAPPPYDEAASA